MPARKTTRTRSSDSKTRTSSQTRRTQAARGPQKGGTRKTKKKQDNTKLFIGIGVGAFLLLFIIIAAANSGDNEVKSSSSSGELSADFLTVSQRKEIYKEYNKQYDALEKEANEKMSYLSMEDRRKQGRTISNSKNRLQAYLPDKMKNIFEGKYKGITVNYIRKHVINAGDAGKF